VERLLCQKRAGKPIAPKERQNAAIKVKRDEIPTLD